MIKKTVYKCEICHTEYLDKSECERCESHGIVEYAEDNQRRKRLVKEWSL